MTEISERYRALSTQFARRVRAVPAGRWDDPSPCEGWSAREVLRHVIGLHRDMPGWAGLTVALKESVDDDPCRAWTEAREQMQALLDDPARAGLEYEGMFGRTRVRDTVDRFLGFDLIVHDWDIARATGQDETLPPDQVHRLYAQTLELGDMLQANGVCGPVVQVPDDAPEQDRLLGLLGRHP